MWPGSTWWLRRKNTRLLYIVIFCLCRTLHAAHENMNTNLIKLLITVHLHECDAIFFAMSDENPLHVISRMANGNSLSKTIKAEEVCCRFRKTSVYNTATRPCEMIVSKTKNIAKASIPSSLAPLFYYSMCQAIPSILNAKLMIGWCL